MSQARLILEHAPNAQSVTEIAYHGGQFTVGRGDDADWSISDPDKFVSRKHFVLSEEAGAIVVTDASTGGLFIDGGSNALGIGNSQPLENGMRLRFGDFVIRIEIGEATEAKPAQPQGSKSGFAFSFDTVEAPPEPQERPDTLPKPFGVQSSSFFDKADAEVEKPLEPLDREDPFALDLKGTKASPETVPSRDSGFFDDTSEAEPVAQAPQNPQPDNNGGGYFGTKPAVADPAPPTAAPVPLKEVPVVPVQPVAAPSVFPASEAALRDAFFRGLGLDPKNFAGTDQVAEMEALGRRFRAMTDGLLHLLRNRAEEKQKVRVAQTIIGSANVNPLKFAVNADDAVSSLVAERGAGYLDPDAAISDGYRDLIDHQMRTWTALQAALRQMIDKFDPSEIEKEVEDTGLIEAVLAGGRSAKLWQLYEERYEDIARAAEERFLGEIGSDFRDAYESKGRE